MNAIQLAEYTDDVKRTECDYAATWKALLPQGKVSLFLQRRLPSLFRSEEARRLIRVDHAVTGLCTETEELRSHTSIVNTKEELGDLLWYCAIGIDELLPYVCYNHRRKEAYLDEMLSIIAAAQHGQQLGDWPPCNQADFGPLLDRLLKTNGRMLDILKKLKFYGPKKANGKAQSDPLYELFEGFLVAYILVGRIAANYGLTLESVGRTNIAKLRVRYPQKFNSKSAHIRNLVAEGNVLKL